MSEEAPSLYQKQSVLESEDWWAVWLGLFIFLLGLGPIYGKDLLGWVVTNNVWVEISKSIKPVSIGYSSLSATWFDDFDLHFYAGPHINWRDGHG